MANPLRRFVRDLTTPSQEVPIRVDPHSHPLNVLGGTAAAAWLLGQSNVEKAILTSQPFVISAAATFGAHQGQKKYRETLPPPSTAAEAYRRCTS